MLIKVLKENFSNQLPNNFNSKDLATPIINLQNEDDYRKYINSLRISEHQKENIFELNDIMFQYNGYNLCQVIDNIKVFEDELILKYNPNEMSNTLISSSVGRYSLAYWDSRVKEITDDTIISVDKFSLKKLFTGIADAIGAAAGGSTIIGGVVGAIGVSAGFATVWNTFAE